MKKLKFKLRIAMQRSELAYDLYLVDKKYFQAKRIQKSNIELYKILSKSIYRKDIKNTEIVFNFLFHLEDWFEQFEEHKNKMLNITLNSEFVFSRLENSPIFPKEFLKNI
tara:strand:- start:970 stop:1299 length:330 start_codon:yes stop_codon:yes gene_type:complete